MRYAGIIYDDTAAAPGLSISFYAQGCPFHCEGCHNPETWDYNSGYEFNDEVCDKIIKHLSTKGLLRNLCILGGEPLCPQNTAMVETLCSKVRHAYPNINIYVWTGYTLEELCNRELAEKSLHNILENTDVLITDPFDISKRDITLELRGSTNQKIYKFVTEEELPLGKQFGFERPDGEYYYILKEGF